MPDVAEVDVFDVDLMKDSQGLGITIAGYVGGDSTPGKLIKFMGEISTI